MVSSFLLLQLLLLHLNIELADAPVVVHVSYLPEDFPLLPAHVVNTHHRPGAPSEAVRVSTVELILVVEENAPNDFTDKCQKDGEGGLISYFRSVCQAVSKDSM